MVDVGDLGRQGGPRQRARVLAGSRPARASRRAASRVPRAAGAGRGSPPRWWRSRRPARPCARRRAPARAAASRQRALPRDLAQEAAVAHQRRRDALRRAERLVAEAALVAEPAVVDLLVVAREHAHDLGVVAHGQLDVALRRAHRADRARALDVPRARAEAVGGRGERAHRAELDDVAAERRHVGAAVVGADEGVVAALEEDELVVLGHLLREAHAAVAEDAALAVDRDERRQLERLLEVALGLDEARAAGAPAEGDVLQRALAALVADRAVERVVDEQELDDRVLRVLDAVRGRVDDHAVAHRRRARGLELRDALDLDQAHAAGADGLAELGLVTEVRGSRRRRAWRRRRASRPRARAPRGRRSRR